MTRRIIPSGPDALQAQTVFAAGEIAYGQASQRMRVGDGGRPGGRTVAYTDDVDLKADESDFEAAVARLALVEGTVTSGRLGFPTYAELQAKVDANPGVIAEVPATDEGTHVDPVTGVQRPNSGVYRAVGSSSLWQWLYASEASEAQQARILAQQAATSAAGSAALMNRVVDSSLDAARNLFDKTRLTVGYVGANGAVVADNNFYTTFFVPVSAGQSVTANATVSGRFAGYVGYYDAAQTMVAVAQNGDADFPAGTPIVVPNNQAIRYARYSVQYADKTPAEFMLVSGTAAPATYRGFGAVDRYTTTRSERAAVRRAVGPYNLFDPTDITDNALLNVTTGAIEAASAAFCVSGYLPLDDSKTIILRQAATPGNPVYGAAWYDIDGNRLGFTAAPLNANTAYVSPYPTAMSVRLNLEKPKADPKAFQVYGGSVLPAQSDPAAMRASAIAASLPSSRNLFRPEQAILGQIRSNVTGELLPNAAVATTGYMPCYPDTKILLTPGNDFEAAVAGIGFCDASGAIIGRINGPVAAGAYSVPPGAATWFCTFYQADMYRLYCGIGTDLPALVPSAFTDTDNTRLKRWAGKTLCEEGDSIVNGGLVAAAYVPFLRVGTYINRGVGGTRMRDILQNRVAADYANVDIVGIKTGTNDFGNGPSQTPLGTPTDAPSIAAGATFWAAMRYTIETLLGWKPTLRLYMMTPLKRADEFTVYPSGTPLKSYVDAIIAGGEMYAVPVYDQYRRSGIGPQTFATFLQDGLHPNAAGGQFVGIPEGRWIEGL